MSECYLRAGKSPESTPVLPLSEVSVGLRDREISEAPLLPPNRLGPVRRSYMGPPFPDAFPDGVLRE